jgi:hypothetical protein
LILFFWYILYVGLDARVPYYEYIDDLIFVTMGVLTLVRILFVGGNIKTATKSHVFLAAILLQILISMLYNGSSSSLALEYAYLVLRPFILLSYLIVFNVDVDGVMEYIVKACKIIVLINLPMMLFIIARDNIKIITVPEYNDALTGFFPFDFVDALVPVFVIIISKVFYDFLGHQKIKMGSFLFYYALLLFTMNIKTIMLVSSAFVWAIIMASKNRTKYVTTILAVGLFTLLLMLPRIEGYYDMIETAPVIYFGGMILSNVVEEYNFVVGTGPGTFSSPSAIRSDSYLAHEYGIFDKADYFRDSGVITGTFTSITSSALTLLGDIGVSGLVIYFLFILSLTYQNFKRISISPVHLIGFIAGVLSLIIGFLLDNWFWGINVFLLVLATKKVADSEKALIAEV